MTEPKPRRRKVDKMADKAQAWISTMWPVLVCIIGMVYHSATFKANIIAELKDIRTSHKFEMKAIKDDARRAELRTVRLENSVLSSESKLTGISKKIDSFVAELKYVYSTKSYVDSELRKKVDLERIDKRTLKN